MFKRASEILFSLIITVCLAANSSTGFAQMRDATRAREVKATGAAEVTVTLNEQFFNSLLEAIFTRLKPPRYPLSLASAGEKEEEESARLGIPNKAKAEYVEIGFLFNIEEVSAAFVNLDNDIIIFLKNNGSFRIKYTQSLWNKLEKHLT